MEEQRAALQAAIKARPHPFAAGSDASHAWFAVYSPSEGWFEFDPTNDQIASSQHIVTAWGRDYGDVAPLRGVIFGGGKANRLSVAVDGLRIADEP